MNEYEIDRLKEAIQQDFPHDDEGLYWILEMGIDVPCLRVMLEKAYRRGVVQGASYTHRAWKEGFTESQIQDWITDTLHIKWRCKTPCNDVMYPETLF